MNIKEANELLASGYPAKSGAFMYSFSSYFEYEGIKYELNEFEGDSLTLYELTDDGKKVIDEKSLRSEGYEYLGVDKNYPFI